MDRTSAFGIGKHRPAQLISRIAVKLAGNDAHFPRHALGAIHINRAAAPTASRIVGRVVVKDDIRGEQVAVQQMNRAAILRLITAEGGIRDGDGRTTRKIQATAPIAAAASAQLNPAPP